MDEDKINKLPPDVKKQFIKYALKLSEKKKTTPVKPKMDRKPFTNKYNNKNNDGKYFVQIASFKNKINAKNLIDKIKSSGIT